MSKTLKYKDYVGSVKVSLSDGIVHGKIEFIDDLVTYQADKVTELQVAFEESVDDYLETCKMLKREPQKSLSGTFNVRVGSDMHKQLATEALNKGLGLNEFVKSALDSYLKSDKSAYHVHIHNISEDTLTRKVKEVAVDSWFGSLPALDSIYQSKWSH